ncbi:HAD-IIIC family phosphatase [Acidithiobacillus thiooxidans]|uniref:HAD-IIIC family phosphatase n=1 Tax=Acidithiobacillus thiooxidans TaxID=930 RepID=UPI0013015DC1|nr:HAD-IIIC family phosphatase [Acidithiobacillus thiooxidans]
MRALPDTEFVEAIYQRYLGRAADEVGKAHYLHLLGDGWRRARVLKDLRRSAEARCYAQYRRRRVAIADFMRQEQPPLLPTDLRRLPLPKPRIALLGTCLAEGLLQVALDQGWPMRHYLADSGLQNVGPEIAPDQFDAVLVNLTLRSILGMAVDGGEGDLFHLRSDLDITQVQEQALMRLRQVMDRLLVGMPAGLPVFFLAFLEPPPQLFGVFGRNRHRSLYALVRALNDAMEQALVEQGRAYFFEINDIRQYYGDATAYDGYDAHYTHHSLSAVSLQGEWIYRDILERLEGAMRVLRAEDPVKLIITDLDNTLWRGVLAEEDEIVPWQHTEGWPLGYAEALLECKRRGILLAICSKNDEGPTRERFQQLWGQRLRLEDFCSVQINWQPKSQNIAEILRITNMLPDYALFIDDNPLEIAEVTREYPQIRTLTGDPERWRHVLLYAPETQVAQVTEESGQRTALVQAKKVRDAEAQSMDRDAWLQSLNLTLRFDRIVDAGHSRYARALELLNRTNQFNTTGQRWSNAEMQDWLASGGWLLAARGEDRFANHGLVALALLRGHGIEQVVLSCRVFGLGIESALLVEALRQMQEHGHADFVGHFTATGRNDACRDFWPAHGFTQEAGSSLWRGSMEPDAPTWIRSEGG